LFHLADSDDRFVTAANRKNDARLGNFAGATDAVHMANRRPMSLRRV
jgi:hypothetical protein